MTRKRRGGSRVAVAVATTSIAYHRLVRPCLLRSGATPDELRAGYAGDDLIPGGRRHSTMATTLVAPPQDVWPWLVQMGADRAGFYSWDRLDNGGRPSAERVRPEWQDLREGGRIASRPDASTWFDVALLEHERSLVLRASLTVPAARWFDPSLPQRPRSFSDSTWGFFLTPTADGRTRLVVTGQSLVRPRRLVGVGNWLFWEPAHWVMQTRQFSNLQRRVTV